MADNKALFERRKRRVRYRVRQTLEGRTRLAVHRTNLHIYAQLIDDEAGRTIATASTVEPSVRKGLKSGSNIEAAQAIGKLIAERAKAAKVSEVVFDRGGYLYHGRVKALADAAREAGLKF